MKKSLLLLFLFAITIYQVNAQACTGAVQTCVPGGPYATLGFYPPYDSLPCAVVGQRYLQKIDMRIPSTTVSGGLTVNIDSIHIVSIGNLPCGLCWKSDVPGNTFKGNTTHCIQIDGTTFDSAGQYNMAIFINVHVKYLGIPVNQLNKPASDYGIKYFAHVMEPGGTCIAIDTLATGRTATVKAPLIAPTIGGSTILCSGGSTTLRLDTTYQSYIWSTGAITRSITVNTPGTYTVTVIGHCDSASKSVTVTAVSLNPSVTPAGPVSICPGGSQTLDAGAGFTTYAWSNGGTTQTINVTTAGSYTCTVTKNGCSATSNTVVVSIVDPSVTITASGATAICAGDSVTLSAPAGYNSYLWSTGGSNSSITVNQTGSYTLSVTKSGCNGTSNTIQVTSTDPSVTITANGATTFCAGGSVTLNAGGGYNTYSWSNGGSGQTINVTQTGAYNCTVTKNGCSATSNTINVSVTTVTDTITANGPTSFCSGGSVTLDAGAGFATYAWSGGGSGQTLNVTQTGNYTATVTKNGCSGTSNTINVSVTDPSVTITAGGPTTFCVGGSVALNAPAGFDTYTWSTTETSQNISVNQSGNYTLSVTRNGCNGTSNTIAVTVNSTTDTVIANGPTSFCAGGSVTLDAGSGYSSYAWSNLANSQTINVTQSGNYSVTVTKNNCSAASNTVVVSVTDPSVSITADGPTTFCAGGSVNLSAAPGYDAYNWSTGSTAQSINVTQSANYTLSVTKNGCNGISNTIAVTSVNVSTTLSANGPTTFCTGGSVTLDAGAGFTSYVWSDASTNQTLNVTQSGDYWATVTQNNCSAVSDTITVNVTSSSLTPVITANGSTNICPGGDVTLDAGAGYTTYTWSNSATSQSTTVSAANTYSVTVTQGTCSGSTSVTVNVGNFPVAVNATPAGPVTACAGDLVVLDAGSGYSAYSWSNGSASRLDTVTSTASYIVTVTRNGCTGTDTVDVTVNPKPVPAISPAGNQTICSGQTVTLDAGSGFDTYAWSSGPASQTIAVSSAASYSVTVSLNGCTATDGPIGVTVNSLPTPTITSAGPTTVCQGDSVTLDAGAGFASYSWSSGESSETITTHTGGVFNVTVTQNNCPGIATPVNVTVNPIPVVSVTASGPTTFCNGDSVTLSAGAGFDTYSWSNSATSASTTVNSGGNYVVTVTKDGCAGISNPLTVTVSTSLAPTITASGPTTFCQGDSVILDAGNGYTTYSWSNGGSGQTITVNSTNTYNVTVTLNSCTGSATPVSVTSNTFTTSGITPSGATTFCQGDSVILTADAGYDSYLWNNGDTTRSSTIRTAGSFFVTTSLNGCSGASNAVTTAVTSVTAPVITASGATTFCQGDSVTLDAGAGYSSYTWSNGGNSQSITVYASASYNVSAVQNGCVRAATPVTVTANSIPAPVITAQGATTFCAGDSVTLEGGNYNSYLWNTNETTANIVVKTAGTYSLTVTQNGCSGSAASPITTTVNAAPVVTITASPSGPVCQGENVMLTATAGFSSYSWSNSSTTASTIVTNGGTYNVTVTQNGCSGSAATPKVVVVNPLPASRIATVSYANNITLTADTVNVDTYQWLYGVTDSTTGVSSLANNNKVLTRACNESGYYAVVTSSPAGCRDTSEFQLVNPCVGVNEITALSNFSARPNPAKDMLYITYDLDEALDVELSIIDLSGRKVLTLASDRIGAGNHQHSININELANGIYMINFMSEKGNLNTKFVKQ